MSQYGAEGAAREGLTTAKIADFYYPGTTWGKAGGRVQVTISADTTDTSSSLRTGPGLTLRDTARSWTRHRRRPTKWPPGGGSCPTPTAPVSASIKDRWQSWGTLEGRGAFAGPGPRSRWSPRPDPRRTAEPGLEPPRSPAAAGHRQRAPARGLPQGRRPAGDARARGSKHAVRAQAVAARTYAAYERAHAALEHPDCATLVLPGLRRLLRRVPGVQRGDRRHRRRGRCRPTARTGVHPVLRRATAGGARPGSGPTSPARGPVRRLVGQRQPRVVAAGPRRRLEPPGPRSATCAGSRSTERDGNGDWGGRVVDMAFVGTTGTRHASTATPCAPTFGLNSDWFTFAVDAAAEGPGPPVTVAHSAARCSPRSALAAPTAPSGRAAATSDVDAARPVVDTEVTTAIDYVAMGDSFSAGPFIGHHAHRPARAARARRTTTRPSSPTGSTSRATPTSPARRPTTADLYAPMTTVQRRARPAPQLDAVSADTDLVTIGIGGNDFGIYDVADHVPEAGVAVCPVDQLRADARKVAGRIEQAVRRITRIAPDARGLRRRLPRHPADRGHLQRRRRLGRRARAGHRGRRASSTPRSRKGAEAAGASYVDIGGRLGGPRRLRQGSGVGQRAALPAPASRRRSTRRSTGCARWRPRSSARSPARTPRSRSTAGPRVVVLDQS